MPTKAKLLVPIAGWTLRVVVPVVLIFSAYKLNTKLKSLKKPPEQIEVKSQALSVDVVKLEYGPHTVELTGLGSVRSTTRVAISPEISGRLTKLHPRLEPGEIIAKGDVLVELDATPFRLARAAKASELGVISAQIDEVQADIDSTAELLAIRRETLATNARILERAKSLLDAKVGTQSEVDRAKQAWLQLSEQVIQLQNTSRKLPTQLKTLHARQDQVTQQLAIDELNIARCQIKAPLTGRLDTVSIEQDQMVTIGQPMLTLIDDTARELAVALEGREVARWLSFKKDAARPGWFAPVEPVAVLVEWIGAQNAERSQPPPSWPATLDRLERFDQNTRTVQAIIKLSAEVGAPPGPALVPGMFCRVRVPGRTLENTAVLPRTAINDDLTVYVVEEGKLAIHPVEVLQTQGDNALIAPGLAAGATVITNRLSAPLPGVAVSIRNGGHDEVSSGVDESTAEPLEDSTFP